MEVKIITLPITGMTCANCVATVERNLKKLDGVRAASVNLATERAAVEYDPGRLGQAGSIARIERAGLGEGLGAGGKGACRAGLGRAGDGVALGEVVLPIRRLSDETDARRLQKALAA